MRLRREKRGVNLDTFERRRPNQSRRPLTPIVEEQGQGSGDEEEDEDEPRQEQQQDSKSNSDTESESEEEPVVSKRKPASKRPTGKPKPSSKQSRKEQREDDVVHEQVYQVRCSPSGYSATDPHKLDTRGPEASGTAWRFTEYCFMTCYHVIEDAAQVKIIIDGSPVTAWVLAINPQLDLAILYTEIKGVPMNIAPESEFLKNGDDVIGHGFPLGHPNLKQTRGTVSGLWGYMCQTSVPSNPGSSGGPLVAALTNNVVAVTASGIPSASAVAFGVPAFFFRQFVACTLAEMSGVQVRFESNWVKGFNRNKFDTLAKKHVAKMDKGLTRSVLVKLPAFDITFQQASAADLQARKVDKRKYTSGIIINALIPSGAFHNAGLKNGDLILEVDGCPVDSHGMVDTKGSPVKMALPRLRLDYYIRQHLPNDKIKVKFNPLGEKGVIKSAVCVLVSGQSFATRPKFWLSELTDYEIFAGFIVVDLSLSLAESQDLNLNPSSDTFKALQFQELNTPRLVVVNVLAGSYAKCKRALVPGDIIDSINGVAVFDLVGFRKAVLASISNKIDCFEIVTRNPKFITIEAQTILDQEPRLSQQNSYTPGKLFNSLKAAFGGAPRSQGPVEDCARA